MKECNTAVVLAGGKSSRLDFDKQTLMIRNRIAPIYIADLLSKEFNRVIIVSNKPEYYRENCPYKVITDTFPGLGPKAGILAGLEQSLDEFVYFTGCDMPFVNLPYIRYMKQLLGECGEETAVLLAKKNGFFEPLNAFYSRKLISSVQAQLKNQDNKISSMYTETNLRIIDNSILMELDPAGIMFTNLNTPKDFELLYEKNICV